MNRRRYLGLVAGSTLGAAAGCTGETAAPPVAETPTSTAAAEPTTPGPVRLDDVDLPVPRSEMYPALPRDYIPAIVDPAFGTDWDGLSLPADSAATSTSLPGDAPVIGVVREGDARAYPLRVLEWHEVVNDALHGPLLVTYCVQCGSAVVADPVVRGRPTTFGVSGLLWRADLVMYDRLTGSLWSQLLATAINGPTTGDRLAVLPASFTTWAAWRADHPDTEVLLPPPRSGTVEGPARTSFDYFTPRYSYDEAPLVGYERTRDALHPQELVLGVEHDGVTRAYPYQTVAETGVVNDTVGDRPVVVATAPGRTLVAYDRRIDGRPRRFAAAGETFLRASGSRWRRTTGVAVDGPHAGVRLTRANDLPPLFWLGWSKFNPETSVYGDVTG
jgi:hypothetical protein